MIELKKRRIGLSFAAVVVALSGCTTSMEDVVKIDSSQIPPPGRAKAPTAGQGNETAMLGPNGQQRMQGPVQPGTALPGQAGAQPLAATTQPAGQQPGAQPSASVQMASLAPIADAMPVGQPAPGIPTPTPRPGGPTIENAVTARLSGPTIENAIVVTALTPPPAQAAAAATGGKTARVAPGGETAPAGPQQVQPAAPGQAQVTIQGQAPAQGKPGMALAYAPQAKAAAMSFAMIDNQFDTSSPVAIPVMTPERPDAPFTTRTTDEIKGLISKYAAIYEVPESLVHRVVHRESKYNAGAFSRGHYGLMQIKYSTAKSMGFDGPAKGLFNAESNLKYAIKYLRGAYIVADRNPDAAVRLYARGYYWDAKRKGRLDVLEDD